MMIHEHVVQKTNECVKVFQSSPLEGQLKHIPGTFETAIRFNKIFILMENKQTNTQIDIMADKNIHSERQL